MTPRIQPLLKAAASFDRTAYGFTPLPTTADDVRFESKPNDGYDAMLHIESRTSRTIAFRKTSGGYKWIGEQEGFRGPKKYTTSDGTFNEMIWLNYDAEPLHVGGFPTNRLCIEYFGEDDRLVLRNDLKLDDIKPILKEWKY